MNKSQNKNRSNNPIVETEFYHRNWHGGCGTHTFKNKIGGAFGITKKEYFKMIEDRNRKLKEQKQKAKK